MKTNLFIRPFITHDANCTHGQEHRECLADLFIQACLPDLLDIDAVRMLKNLHLLASDGSEDSDSQTWAREWVPLDEIAGYRQEST